METKKKKKKYLPNINSEVLSSLLGILFWPVSLTMWGNYDFSIEKEWNTEKPARAGSMEDGSGVGEGQSFYNWLLS